MFKNLFKKHLTKSPNKLKPLQRLSLFFFTRPRKTALIWLVVTLLGAASYSTLLKREGFPSVATPFAVAKGTYLVNDPAKVDSEVGKPLSEFLLKQDGVKTTQSIAQGNFYSVIVNYEEDVDAKAKSQELKSSIDNQNLLPEQATLEFDPYEFGFTERGDDLVVSFYPENGTGDTKALIAKAKEAAEFFKSKNIEDVTGVSLIDQLQTATNPQTQKAEVTQQSFDRYGSRENGANKFYKSVVIGFMATEGSDNVELDDRVAAAVDELNNNPEFDGYKANISGSYAPDIRAQINELQQVLLEGLLAVLVIGSIIIAVRASLITVLAMVTVLATVNALLWAIGYTLNTITLFALILALSLIIDDTIIMVEAIDAQRRKQKQAKEAIKVATGKISRAMLAATSTAALSFLPLVFVGGILGSFIRAIPITIISALVISLFVALIFIPLFARFLLLGKKQMGEGNVREIAAGAEAKIAEFLAKPMLWARHSRKKLFGVGVTAVLIGFIFIGAGGFLFQKVTFNIFPSNKDSNQLLATINFRPGTNIEQAQSIADEANQILADTIGEHFDRASFYGQANLQTALLFTYLSDYKERDIKAPELVDQLEAKFASFDKAQVKVVQVDAGPPVDAFAVRVDSSQNREAALRLRDDILKYLSSAELKRVDGSIAKIKSVTAGNNDVYSREDNQPYVEATAAFEDTDTTTLVTLAQQAVEKEFSKERVASYGLSDDAVDFNFGQEEENQDSFKTLAVAFPLVLIAIYVLLAIQFRSLLQPLLIFMAIPFSLFGITLGLYITDNAFSFFAMLGFFALIGLSIKNTILLTDYANQARRAGQGAVDAAHAALAERFRPLIATSLTAVVSLIPLALTSPFWEGLTVVLIFGLLSSTLLVITVFPYYYLGAEYLRAKFSRKTVLLWLAINIVAIIGLSAAGLGAGAIFVPIATALAIYVFHRTHSRPV